MLLLQCRKKKADRQKTNYGKLKNQDRRARQSVLGSHTQQNANVHGALHHDDISERQRKQQRKHYAGYGNPRMLIESWHDPQPRQQHEDYEQRPQTDKRADAQNSQSAARVGSGGRTELVEHGYPEKDDAQQVHGIKNAVDPC